MLQILLIMLAMTSCIDSQAREIIDTAKEAAEMANDIAKKMQLGNLCFKNDDCYLINVFQNLCSKEYAITGQCCNYFPQNTK